MNDNSMGEMAALTSAEIELAKTAAAIIGGGVKGLGKLGAFLIALLQKEKVMGETNCKQILRKVVEQGGTVEYFRLEEKHSKAFFELAEKYGLLYAPLKDLNKDDGKFEVMFHSSAKNTIAKIMQEGGFGEIISEEEYLNNASVEKAQDAAHEGFIAKKLESPMTLLGLESGVNQNNSITISKTDLSSWNQDKSEDISLEVITALNRDEDSIIMGQNGSDYILVTKGNAEVNGKVVAGKSVEIFSKDGVLKQSTHTGYKNHEEICEFVKENAAVDNGIVLNTNTFSKEDIRFMLEKLSSDQQKTYAIFRECEKRMETIENPGEFMTQVFGTNDINEFKQKLVAKQVSTPEGIRDKIHKTPVVPKGMRQETKLIADKLEEYQKKVSKAPVQAVKQVKKKVQGV